MCPCVQDFGHIGVFLCGRKIIVIQEEESPYWEEGGMVSNVGTYHVTSLHWRLLLSLYGRNAIRPLLS